MELILCADIGTTNIKAGLVDASSGAVLAATSTPQHGEVPGGHDPEKLRTLVVETLRKIHDKAPAPVRAVGLSGYQFGLLLLDADDRPLTAMRTLKDEETREGFAQFRASFDTRYIFQITGCPPIYQYALPRLVWIRENRPELWARVRRIVSLKAWIMHTLTGQWITDAGTESASQLMNLQRRNWEPALLAQAGISADWLPRIATPADGVAPLSSSASELTGIAVGTPVHVGTYDGAALAVGVRACEPGIAVLNLGTSGMLRVVNRHPVVDDPTQMRYQSYAGWGGDYLLGGGLNNAGQTLGKITSLLGNPPMARLMEEAAASPPGARGLMLLPYLTGERDWRRGDRMTGVFQGLRLEHQPGDLARAALEGVAFGFRDIATALRATGNTLTRVRGAGGGLTESPLWTSIIADALNVPIEVSDVREPALLGIASMVTGIPPASDSRHTLYAPDSERADLYSENYQRFVELRETLWP